ncbi:MAG: arsenite methyltransferase [Dehalococcoidales bacterium]|nr:MAG: arsenite methyltransferase [Dehalococcoidales bacterium]
MKDSISEEEIRKLVREGYAHVATGENSCCSPANSCCSDTQEDTSKSIGYTDEDINSVPDGANLGLGCGNPVALASLKEGEVVLDLGSGAGFDCFLAAECVGSTGRVIGVDMTPEMIGKARENAIKGEYTNVEFRLGEIENLPVPDNHVDIVISNCVINLVPDKTKVFQEMNRVLKPGGRLMISDIVLEKDLPDVILNSASAYVACVAGASLKQEYLDMIEEAGFQEVAVTEETSMPLDIITSDPSVKEMLESIDLSASQIADAAGSVKSIRVYGLKPA